MGIYIYVYTWITVFLLLSKQVSLKSKTLVNFESPCYKIDVSTFFIVFRRVNRSAE